jgi:5-deoxy-glucuronate isomerase
MFKEAVTMEPIFKTSPAAGHQSVFQIGEQNIRWLGLEILRLDAGQTWEGALKDEEAGLVILTGKCTVTVNETKWTGLGGRADMFAAASTCVYAPRNSTVTVTAESKIEIAICKAPCDVDKQPALIKPEDNRIISAGMANWRRDVRLVIPPGSPISQRLIIGETINPPGNWSGIPPHKHDEITSIENVLEEFYYFKIKPADGFGVQLIYKGETKNAVLINNGDVAILQSGYHPTVAAPGTTIGYLWTLSGDSKAYDITTDPRFAWVTNAEAVLKELQHN